MSGAALGIGAPRYHVEQTHTMRVVSIPDPLGLYFPLMRVWEQNFAVS